MITHRCACEKSYMSIIMTSITWAGPSCVQELGTFLAPQNRIQGRCEYILVLWPCPIETHLSVEAKPGPLQQVDLGLWIPNIDENIGAALCHPQQPHRGDQHQRDHEGPHPRHRHDVTCPGSCSRPRPLATDSSPQCLQLVLSRSILEVFTVGESRIC